MKTSYNAIVVLLLLCTSGKGMKKKQQQKDLSFSLRNCPEQKRSRALCKKNEVTSISNLDLEYEDRRCDQKSDGDNKNADVDNKNVDKGVCNEFKQTAKFNQTCYETCEIRQNDLIGFPKICRLELTLTYECSKQGDCQNTKLNCWDDVLASLRNTIISSSPTTVSLSLPTSILEDTNTTLTPSATSSLETSRTQPTDSLRSLVTQLTSRPIGSSAINVTDLKSLHSRKSKSRRVLISSIVASVVVVVIVVIIILLLKYRKQQLIRFFSCINCSETHEQNADAAVYEMPDDNANQAVFKIDRQSTPPAAYEEIKTSDKQVVENILYEENITTNQAQYDQLNFSTPEKNTHLNQYDKLDLAKKISKSEQPLKEMHENQIYVIEQTDNN